MKSILICLCACIYLLAACTAGKKNTNTNAGFINQIIKDNQNKEMLVGRCTKEALRQPPFADWFVPNYNAYKVDSATCNLMKGLWKNKRITIFMGTWCGDSRREVPRMLKLLECAGFPDKQLSLVMVSNQPEVYKQSPQHEEAGRNIKRVPTLIVEERGTERGRVIEYPVVSLEKDLLKILSGENYIPNYSSLTGQ